MVSMARAPRFQERFTHPGAPGKVLKPLASHSLLVVKLIVEARDSAFSYGWLLRATRFDEQRLPFYALQPTPHSVAVNSRPLSERRQIGPPRHIDQ
jgi:hypothetical protein